MDENPWHFPSELSLGYAGIHRTVFAALHYLTHLQPADMSEVAEENKVCVICNDPHSDEKGHDLVQLDCGHFFGRSCLLLWLTPVENKGDRVMVALSDGRVRSRLEYDRVEEEEDEEEEDMAEEAEHEEDEDEEDVEGENEGSEDTTSRAGQPTAESPDVGSRSTSPSTPVNRSPHFIRPSSLVDGQDVVNQVIEALYESPEVPPPRRVGIRDPEYRPPRYDPEEQPDITQPDNSPFDPMRSPTSPVPLTHDMALQEIPNLEHIVGVAVRRLVPGNNTCPLCRAILFPKPAHGESLRRIRLCVRVWDLAYKYACIQRNQLEDDYRFAVLAYGHMWDSTRATADEYEEIGLELEQRHVFQFAAGTLIGVNEQREVFFGRQWTDEQRQSLETFGRYMKFREADIPVWFPKCETLEDVRMIHVWFGPDRTQRLARRSSSAWIQVRIKDHPHDFRLGSDDEDVESSDGEDDDDAIEEAMGVEEDENEDEAGVGHERRENEVDMSEEGGNDLMAEDSSDHHSSLASREYDNLEQPDQGDKHVMADRSSDDVTLTAGEESKGLGQSEGGSSQNPTLVTLLGMERSEALDDSSSDDLSLMDPKEFEELEQLYGKCSDLSSMAPDELGELGRSFSNTDEALNNAAEESELESPEEEDDAMDVDYEP